MAKKSPEVPKTRKPSTDLFFQAAVPPSRAEKKIFAVSQEAQMSEALQKWFYLLTFGRFRCVLGGFEHAFSQTSWGHLPPPIKKLGVKRETYAAVAVMSLFSLSWVRGRSHETGGFEKLAFFPRKKKKKAFWEWFYQGHPLNRWKNKGFHLQKPGF